MFALSRFAAFVLLSAVSAQAQPQSAVQAEARADRGALAAAVRDLCGREVALLGEADHGDGRAVSFKAALVRELVTRCHYDAVFFEGSFYEFLNFSRRLRIGQAVSPDLVSAAIGGLWKFDAELAPLIPFLFAEARAGRLVLGGIDDQAGGFQQPYSNDAMSAEMAGLLESGRRAECGETLRRRIYGDYQPADAAAMRARAGSCLAEIGRAVARSRDLDGPSRAEMLAMTAGFARFNGRDPADMDRYIQGRDRSMYLNFRWLADRLPPRRRIIVWAATSHVAKDGTVRGGYDANGRNFGSYVHEAYGRRAFALGFSALAGAHYWSRSEPRRSLPVAAPGSLEARALAGSASGTFYLGPARVAALGTLPGSLFSHAPASARWSDVVDGVVVFREERPPRRID
jgi:erythromycin esterase-like protein